MTVVPGTNLFQAEWTGGTLTTNMQFSVASGHEYTITLSDDYFFSSYQMLVSIDLDN